MNNNKQNKVYVITRCASESNYSPFVFTSYELAVTHLSNIVDEIVENSNDNIMSYKTYSKSAIIEYTDNTYDVFNIFECEVNDEQL